MKSFRGINTLFKAIFKFCMANRLFFVINCKLIKIQKIKSSCRKLKIQMSKNSNRSRLLHTRPLPECTIPYSTQDLAVLGYRTTFQLGPRLNVSKIVMNFKTGASIPAIVNLASRKANQLFASRNQKDGILKLKSEVKISLLAEMFLNVFYRLIDQRNQIVYWRKLAAI